MDLVATIVIVVAFIVFVSLAVKASQTTVRRSRFLVGSLVALVIAIATPVIGHSSWNRNQEFSHALNGLSSFNAGPALVETSVLNQIIASPHPLNYTIVSSSPDPSDPQEVLDVTLNIQGQMYQATFVDPNEPLGWTPYEHWELVHLVKG